MEKCMFEKFGLCSILKVTECSGCKFRATQAEFVEGQKRAKKILKAKGLEPYVKHISEGKTIMSVRRIDDESKSD